jgi:hypothetical protein
MASAKLTPRSGSSATNTRRSRAASALGSTSSFFATASNMRSRSRVAAWIAAWPAISVTREE